jgi:repressor of nif and glnA expression
MITLAYPHDIEKKTILILKVLSDAQEPMGSRLIARQLQDYGIVLSERTVRYHLKLMDERGLTSLIGRHDGRVITEMGIEEINSARVHDKVGLSITRIENLAFKTTFDPEKGRGLLPVNVSFFPKDQSREALDAMAPAFKSGIFSSGLVACADEGGKLGEITIPESKVGFATVCSVAINGVLLKNGVPMDSKFGGILQITNKKPLRFTELIYYSGTSLDPSEVFIRGKMTSVRQASMKGEGRILSNFREIPASSQSLVEKIVSKLKKVGIDGVLSIGEMSEPVCQIPVDVNKVGMILMGGLNPVACVEEVNIQTENHTMSTMMDYEQLVNFKTLLKKKR